MTKKNEVFSGVTLCSLVHTLQTGSGYRGFSPGESGWSGKLTVHLYPTPKLKNKYESRSESKERFAIQRYLLIMGKKQNMQVLSHTFTYFPT